MVGFTFGKTGPMQMLFCYRIFYLNVATVLRLNMNLFPYDLLFLTFQDI